MIKGIGTDVTEVARIAEAIKNPRFLARVFTQAEQEYCESRGSQRVESYAARFCAKEAVLKAFGTGLRGGRLLDIEVHNDALGAPYVTLAGYFTELAHKKHIQVVWISLSHTKNYATAQCVMEGSL